MNYRVHEAAAADLPGIVALERRIFSDPWSLDSFRSCLDEILLLADSEGVVCGYLAARAVPPEGEILTIGVAEAARKRGIGDRLMSAGLAELHRRAVRRVYLEVRDSNVGAIDFYEKRGFVVIGRRPGYYSSPAEDALVMMRQNLPQ